MKKLFSDENGREIVQSVCGKFEFAYELLSDENGRNLTQSVCGKFEFAHE